MIASYYSDLLNVKVKPTFCTKRNRSIRSVIILEKLHWEILPHSPCSPDLLPCDFDLFGPLKQALGVSNFQNDNDVAEFV